MLLTTKEIADKLRIHPRTVRNHINSGKLKAIKVGRLWRVEEEDLKRFLEGGNEQGN